MQAPCAAVTSTASSAETNRMATSRFSQMMRLASSSARAICSQDMSRARSIVEISVAHVKAGRRILEEAIERSREHVLSGVLLHMIERGASSRSRRSRRSPTASGADRMWTTSSSASIGVDDINRRTQPRPHPAPQRAVRMSKGWPPDVG